MTKTKTLVVLSVLSLVAGCVSNVSDKNATLFPVKARQILSVSFDAEDRSTERACGEGFLFSGTCMSYETYITLYIKNTGVKDIVKTKLTLTMRGRDSFSNIIPDHKEFELSQPLKSGQTIPVHLSFRVPADLLRASVSLNSVSFIDGETRLGSYFQDPEPVPVCLKAKKFNINPDKDLFEVLMDNGLQPVDVRGRDIITIIKHQVIFKPGTALVYGDAKNMPGIQPATDVFYGEDEGVAPIAEAYRCVKQAQEANRRNSLLAP